MGKTIIINEGGTAGSFNLLPFYWQGVFYFIVSEFQKNSDTIKYSF